MKIIERFPKENIAPFLKKMLDIVDNIGSPHMPLLATVIKLLSEDLPDRLIWIIDKDENLILNPKSMRDEYLDFKTISPQDSHAYVIYTSNLNIEPLDWEMAGMVYNTECIFDYGYRLKSSTLIEDFKKVIDIYNISV